MAGGVKPKREKKEPGGLVQMDKTAELYKNLRKKSRPLWKSDWRK